MKEDVEFMDELCSTTAPSEPPTAGRAAVPIEEGAAVGEASSPTAGESRKDAPPLMVTPSLSAENMAVGDKQQQKAKNSRKRQTQQEILLAQKKTYLADIEHCETWPQKKDNSKAEKD